MGVPAETVDRVGCSQPPGNHLMECGSNGHTSSIMKKMRLMMPHAINTPPTRLTAKTNASTMYPSSEAIVSLGGRSDKGGRRSFADPVVAVRDPVRVGDRLPMDA